MPVRDRSNTTVLHPDPAGASRSWYFKGCRCDGCRAANAEMGRDRRRRLAEGVASEFELVPSRAAHGAILRLRGRGMLWLGLEELAGMDRRDLQRVSKRPDGMVTRRTEATILAAERRLDDDPGLLARGRSLFEQGDRVRWMIGCLLARGWDSLWIGRQVGWTHRLSMSIIPYSTVTIDLWGRVEGVFKAYHETWGPSRMTAVRAWRMGAFFSDCYDTEESDYRPIPGTLHPDLVVEACTFNKNCRKDRGRSMLTDMHLRYGQWESEPCAAAALRRWAEVFDVPVEGRANRACGLQSHRHDVLPSIWRGDAVELLG